MAGGHEGLKSRPAPVEDRRLSDAQPLDLQWTAGDPVLPDTRLDLWRSMMSGVKEGGMDRSSGSRFGAPDGRPKGGR